MKVIKYLHSDLAVAFIINTNFLYVSSAATDDKNCILRPICMYHIVNLVALRKHKHNISEYTHFVAYII